MSTTIKVTREELQAMLTGRMTGEMLEAVNSGDTETLKYLLEKSDAVHLDSRDCHGRTALHICAAKGKSHREMLRFLIEAGANIEAKYKNGTTPLMYAIRYRNEEAVCALLNRGANIDVKDIDGHTPLMHASAAENSWFAEVLINVGADIETTNAIGRTAMNIAARYGRTMTVCELYRAGANLETKDANGQTPLALAMAKDHDMTAVAIEELIAIRNAAAFGELPFAN